MRIIWQTVKSITNEILGVKEPEWLWKNPFTFMLLFSLWTCCWFTHTNMWFFLLLLLLLSKYKQVFCSSLKAWMSVITAFWKIVLKYTWTWYGNCLSAPCNQKNMLSPYLSGKFHLQCGFWSKWISDICECLI